jgi:hypothetical protein
LYFGDCEICPKSGGFCREGGGGIDIDVEISIVNMTLACTLGTHSLVGKMQGISRRVPTFKVGRLKNLIKGVSKPLLGC